MLLHDTQVNQIVVRQVYYCRHICLISNGLFTAVLESVAYGNSFTFDQDGLRGDAGVSADALIVRGRGEILRKVCAGKMRLQAAGGDGVARLNGKGIWG
jgi:hypothetical protein